MSKFRASRLTRVAGISGFRPHVASWGAFDMQSDRLTHEQFAATIGLIDDLRETRKRHCRWLMWLHRCMVSSQKPDRGAIEYKEQCSFETLRQNAQQILSAENGESLRAIGVHHEAMHEAGDRLTERLRDGSQIPLADYEAFAEHVSCFSDLAETLERELWDNACLTDPLTGLRNRNGMMVELREEQQRTARERTSCTIAMVDCDHFKDINDSYGHGRGDGVLCAMGRHIQTRLRPYDRAYRLGGEEFLLCLPDSSVEQAKAIVERIRAELAQHPVTLDDGRAIQITASFGIASLHANCTIDEILERADRALYAAKAAGRNRVVVWDTQLHEQAQ
jgi:diguanylate cyclase